MAERLQLRRDTAAQWAAVNPILRLCEIGLVVDLAGHVTGMKIGDGRVWNALPLIPIAEKVGTSMIADGAVTSEKIAEGVIPTKVSELTNDENYAKTSAIPTKVSQLTNDAQYAKTSAIPTKVSQLTNDSGYLNEAFAENLILNSRFGGNAEKWEGSGYQVLNDIHERGVSGVAITEGSIGQMVDLEEGYYTLSFMHAGEYGENYIYLSGDCEDFVTDLDGDEGEYALPNRVDAYKYTISFYCHGGDLEVNFEAPGEMSISEVKLEKSKKASGYSLNTLDIVDKYTIAGGGSSKVTISGKLCLTDLSAVKAAMSGLAENEARFFVITDSQGRIPSTQKCYDVPSEIVREMSLKTGNTLVDGLLNAVEVQPIGVSVGDLIALTKVSVNLSDLAAAVGITASLSGTMLVNQYKILHTNGTREENYEEGCTKGVYGLLSPWNKQMIDGSAKPTRWAWGTNLDDLLQSGVLAFTSADIEGVAANWTIFVDCSASPDGSGFYHLTQTAIGRDDAVNLGDVYMRLGYYQKGAAPTFLPWKKLSV